MKIQLQYGLPFVAVALTYQARQLILENVLIDTGSAGCVFPTERLFTIGLTLEAQDSIHQIRGVGGIEYVFAKQVERLSIGDLSAEYFEIEVGAMDYGFAIDGIVGMNFLTEIGAVVDLARLEIYQA